MSEQRKLTIEENLEQLRLTLLENMRAYFQGNKPRDKKFEDAIRVFRDVTSQMHEIGAEKNRWIALIGMLNPKQREIIVKNMLQSVLPNAQAKLLQGKN